MKTISFTLIGFHQLERIRKLSIPFPSQQKAQPGAWKLCIRKAGLLPILLGTSGKLLETVLNLAFCCSLLRQVFTFDNAKTGLCTVFAQPAFMLLNGKVIHGAGGATTTSFCSCLAEVLYSSQTVELSSAGVASLMTPGGNHALFPTPCHQSH